MSRTTGKNGKAAKLPAAGFLSTPYAAKIIGVSERTLWRWITRGLVPPFIDGAGAGALYGWALAEVVAGTALRAFTERLDDLPALIHVIAAVRAWPPDELDDAILVERADGTFELRRGGRRAVVGERGERTYCLALALAHVRTTAHRLNGAAITFAQSLPRPASAGAQKPNQLKLFTTGEDGAAEAKRPTDSR